MKISGILFLLFISVNCFATDRDSCDVIIEKQKKTIDLQRTALSLYGQMLENCDSSKSLLMKAGLSVDSDNRRMRLELLDKNQTIKSQNIIIKVLAAVVVTFVAGEVVRDLARK